MEKKGGASSWVRLGAESLTLFLEGLYLCIKDEKEIRWGREWKEQGRVYSMTRGTNRAGGFIRLGVSDVEGRRFCIFVPRGRRDKKGWTIMAENLKQVLGFFGKNPETYKGKGVEKVAMGGPYAAMVRKSPTGKPNAAAIKVKKEETKVLKRKLKYCVVASWRDGSGGEEDIKKWGKFWAKSWDLKGNLGLAKLNKRKALLEFEDLEEARRVVASGSCAWEGTQVRLEHWSPRSGCWAEGEERRDVWVRIVGLPISLWSPEILRRVGDACGGFITADENTRSMRDLQWARILVKWGEEARPNVLEIEGEEESYVVSLWWECWPVLRRKCRDEDDHQSREVRGEEEPRAGQRVMKGWGSGRLEVLQPSDDGTVLQGDGSGRTESELELSPSNCNWVSSDDMKTLSPVAGPKETRREDGPSLLLGFMDLKNKGVAVSEVGPDEGPSEVVGCYSKSPAWSPAQRTNKGLLCLKACSSWQGSKALAAQEVTSLSLKGPAHSHLPEAEFFAARENEDTRKPQGGVRLTETDRALEEELMRYGKGVGSWGKKEMGNSHLTSLSFDRTLGGESFDHSWGLDEEGRADKSLWLTVYKACNERIKECKELGGVHCNSDKSREMEGVGDIDDAQVVRSELEGNWEESGLARFGNFLGFPTEGLEKEILNFLTKIRKRREKIHSKELLEKSKFERELKRLECSINYEGGLKQKGSVQGKGRQIVVVQ